MTPTLYLRTAVPADAGLILAWRRATAEWLAATHGTDQWSTPYDWGKVEGWVREGYTFMAALEPDGEPVATITSTPGGDPALWTADELLVPARYLNKANVTREYAGLGIGACLIAWATTRAAKAGVDLIRIDVWSTNRRLQDYYRQMGFQHLRTVPNTVSGALFELPATVTPDLPVVERLDLLDN